jgi:mannose/cellobiose epimerase-like protein (N-acyl-D-glucosamine 2-epimerase family)
MRRLMLFLVLCLALLAPIAAQNPGVPPDLVKGEWWLSHLVGDLLPFWHQEAAWGTPLGNFNTTRCDDGSRVNWQRPCVEVSRNSWLMQRERYLVAQSRQTYAYGVVFHMTGDPTYLDLMREGVKFIRANAVDRERGGLFTLQQPEGDTGKWGPAWENRDPQQLAYGLLGMSFYYYLTRDPEVLPDIIATKRFIFDRYYNPNLGAMQWMLANQGTTRAEELRLVAQLDQMNAYMVMLTPLLPEPERADWINALKSLSSIMIYKFYSPKDNLMFLSANSPADLDINQTGTDFGHTIKAMWMIRFTGLLAGDESLVRFAEENGPKVLERAYLADSGSWATTVLKGGMPDTIKSWWIYCELDQFAGTMALQDPKHAKYLPKTQAWWLENFVDHKYGEVWSNVDGRTGKPPANDTPKQWPWKNGYHSLEHALVNYIVAQQLYSEPVKLYFGFQEKPNDAAIRPYFFTGRIEDIQSWPDDRGGLVWGVTFRDVR